MNLYEAVTAAEPRTYGALAMTKLTALAQPLGLTDAHQTRLRDTFGKLSASFAAQLCTRVPGWRSGVTDDGSPFELSLELDGDATTVRMLVETWDPAMSAHRGWDPAWALCRSLREEPGVDTSRLEAIGDLYAPDHRVPAEFSMWHAAVVPPTGEAFYKVYLNPQVLGESVAPAIVRETLKRLGFDDAWDHLRTLLAAGGSNNRLRFVSLDLVPDDIARVKVYVAHHATHMSELEQQLTPFRGHHAGDAMWLSRTLATHDGPYDERPPLTCLGFTSSAPEDPQVTTHFPARLHAPHDAELLRRLCGGLDAREGTRLGNAVRAYAGRELSEGRGLITWVSARASSSDHPRTTIYLSPEAHEVVLPQREDLGAGLVRRSGIVMSRSSGQRSDEPPWVRIQRRVDFHEQELLDHPFLSMLEGSSNIGDVRQLAENLSFFVMAFQDMLRLVAAYAQDARFSEIAQQHYLEDAGHEQWFLEDARALGIRVDAKLLFAPSLQAVRDASFELIGLVRRAHDDASRLALVFALESSGQLFFERVVGILDRVEGAPQLTYFGRHHQQVEQSHAVSEDALQAYLRTLELTPESVAQAEMIVELVFQQMWTIADAVLARVRPLTEEGRGVA